MHADQEIIDGFDRLAGLLMRTKGLSYDAALDYLKGLSLSISCGEELHESSALQAAVLTAVASGSRAFRGGVFVNAPASCPLLVPCAGARDLGEAVNRLGGHFGSSRGGESFTLTTGPGLVVNTPTLRIIADGWRGGVAPAGCEVRLEDATDFALGGVLAGALGVAKGFSQVCGLSQFDVDEPTGVSLWNPATDWLSAGGVGPPLRSLPQKLCLLGLGHLGQATAFTLSLLPFRTDETEIMLVDHQRLVKGNWASGVLCNASSVGLKKARVAAAFFEAHQFLTTVVERKFDNRFRVREGEPRVAICGFDSASARVCLEEAGFDLVIDIGIGGGTSSFDRLRLNTFPEGALAARELFADSDRQAMTVPRPFADLAGDSACGVLAENLAGISIATSFVGMFAAAMAVGEIVRGVNGGGRVLSLASHLRSQPLGVRAATGPEVYALRFARNGLRDRAVPARMGIGEGDLILAR